MARLEIHSLVLPMLVYLLARQKTEPIEDKTPQEQYDYIIVGGGTAGSLLANRLSENGSVKVLLVEAGGKDNVTTEVPALAIMLTGSEYDWGYNSTQQTKACLSAINKQCYMPSGKLIGGSSSIGFMGESRGHKTTYDEWEASGNEGWSFEKVLPYFKKHENDRTNGKCVESELHNCGGEMEYISITDQPAISKAFMESLETNGYQEVDLNGNEIRDRTYNKGVFAIKNGIRVSAANAFLKPIQHRPNLDIALNTFVTKVMVDPELKTATGVVLKRPEDAEPRTVTVTKEVILSAGALRSPQILMLSGIGPKTDLQKLNIPVVGDLPGVGTNLQDLLSTMYMITADRPLQEQELNMIDRSSIIQWAKGRGPMALPAGIDVFAFMRSASRNGDAPDICVTFQSLPLLSIASHYFRKLNSMTDEAWEETFLPVEDKPAAILNIFLKPKSKGSVKLVSKDPYVYPEINPNIFAEEDDLEALVEGLETAVNLTRHQAIKDLGFEPRKFKLKACSQHPPLSHAFFECWVKHFSFSRGSVCCTNHMGPNSDSTAVVDNRLRVKGVKNLRVVDASALPKFPSGGLLQTVYAVAEKAAAMIKEDNHR